MSLELDDALMTTRSMRRFTDEPVDDADVEWCLRAAVQASNGGNIQPYRFVVVTDADKRAQIGEIYLRAWDRYEPAVRANLPPSEETDRNYAISRRLAERFGEVPVHVLVLMPQIEMTVRDDEGVMDVGPLAASVYPAVQNLILAARSRGLGTVLTTVWRPLEHEVRAVCGIPDSYTIAALLPVGHPKGRWGVAPRRPAEHLTSWNTFGTKRAPTA